ncbi:MAG: tRNA (adenosine(37)-N6)-dimethylallyltransferase MiaA [Anaerolineales bacterium]
MNKSHIRGRGASDDHDHIPNAVEAFQSPLVVILGPTAVGKTELAIQIARQLNGEIISADSRLLYRGMNIGTAKPTLEQRQQVPHHLIDVAEPDQIWSLTLFQRRAREAIRSIQARNCLPLLVGGTGQYIRAIVEDWQIPEVKPDLQLRKALETWSTEIGKDGLHARLAVLDPESARKIDPRNLRRTIRALEVILRSGKKFSDQSLRGKSTYDLVQIGLSIPRTDLFERIDSRIDDMFANGFISEVQALLARGYAPDLASFSAIGYSEVIDYLLGKTTLEEAVTLIRRRTRLFVRRQANWFKEDDPYIHWFKVNDHPMKEIESLLRCKLQLD